MCQRVPFESGGTGGIAQQQTRRQIQDNREQQHHDHKRVRRRVRAQFRDPVEDLDRGHRVIPEHQGRTQFRKTPDQHDTSARQDPGPGQRQCDPEETFPRRDAHILRRFDELRILIRQCRHQIQIHDGIKMQGFHYADAPEPAVTPQKVVRTETEHRKDAVQHPVMPQDLLESQRTHKGRQDHGCHHHGGTGIFPGEIVPVVKQSQREREKEYQQRCHDADAERIPDPFQIKRIPAYFAEDLPVKSLFQHRPQGQKKEQDKEYSQEQRTQRFKYGERFHSAPPFRASSAAFR